MTWNKNEDKKFNGCRLVTYSHRYKNARLSIHFEGTKRSAIYYVDEKPLFWKEFSSTVKLSNIKSLFSIF